MSALTRTFRRMAATVFGVLLSVGLAGGLAYANTTAHNSGRPPVHSVPAGPSGGGGLGAPRAE